ncbi:MAG TPA: SurA N-terminal domain-containing protein [Polyangiaceae bacterium]|nr:SurA N-terminal domain-containing protein [Polyangiaceae bacterium]
MRLPKLAFAFVVGALALLGGSSPARAVIVERVVAVIGERPLLWTELVHRAAATRIQIRMQTRDANVVSVQEQEMYKELLQRMIDDRLEEQQADRAHISVSPEEIDRGIANIAAQAQAQQGRPVAVEDVLGEIRRRGMTDQDFRDEIRRQILEGKLIELRVRPRVRITDQDAHAAYQHWTQELKDKQPVDVRTLALRVQSPATQGQVEARTTLAQEIVRKARSGTDFCALVSQYSDDASTRDACGSRGPQPFASLIPAIQDAVRTTKPGTVSDPIPVHIGPDDAIIVLMYGETRTPPFEQVKNEMEQQATLEALERARKQWLKDLRRKVYVDVRL